MRRSVASGLETVAAIVAVLWLVQLVLSIPGVPPPVAWGIIPRTTDGLAGIISAPFVHGSWAHLIANTIPLFIFGTLVAMRGVSELFVVLQISILVAGAGTWLFGRPASHLGASGVVFGLFGFLIFRCVYDRKITSLIVALIVALAWGGAMMTSLIPQEGVSWTGHFFGFVGGCLAARHRYGGKLRLVR